MKHIIQVLILGIVLATFQSCMNNADLNNPNDPNLQNSGQAPTAYNLNPADIDESTPSTIQLSYTDNENDLAESCSVTNLSNLVVIDDCTCSIGICSVVVQSLADYQGDAGFDFTVTSNSQISNIAYAALRVNPVEHNPVASNLAVNDLNEDIQKLITLSYTDDESDQATTCDITNLSNVSISQACACLAGVCSVGVTGTLNYNGPASFDYTVTANGQTSNSATATLNIMSLNDAPVVADISPAAFNEDTQSVITLNYTDVESHPATACTISNLSNVTVTQACACVAGTCTVGVTGTANYNGAASFDYTVTANGLTSASAATATLSITAVADAPVASNISPAAFNEDTQSVITLSYTDNDGDLGTSCSLSGLTNVTVTQACACNGAGVCTVGVKGTVNYNGAASFAYTVSANSQASNSASASLTINAVDDAPWGSINSAEGDEDTESIITLTYFDPESDSATSCSITDMYELTETQACACNAGVCTVGLTGTSNFNGDSYFAYTITANSKTSSATYAYFHINPISDAVALDVSLFPAQDLILPSDADIGDVVSDVSSKNYLFHFASPVYSLVANTPDNNFSISAAGVLSVDSMTNLSSGQTYSITVRAEDAAKMLYDEKIITIKVIDSSEIIYIDPDYVGIEAGARTHPYNTWEEAYLGAIDGKYLLQKRGTTITTAGPISHNANDVTYGAYGVGERPIVMSGGFIINNTSGNIFRDLHLKAVASGDTMIFLGYLAGNQIKILNTKIEGGEYGIIGEPPDILIQNCEITSTNNIRLIGSNTAEISFNYMPQITLTGIFFWNVVNINIHHNIMEHTILPSAYCIHGIGDAPTSTASYNYNYCKGNPVAVGIKLDYATPMNLTAEIVGNKIHSVETGIYVSNVSMAKIHSNEIYGSSVSVKLGDEVGGELYNNLFKDFSQSGVEIFNVSSQMIAIMNNIFDGEFAPAIMADLSRISVYDYNISSWDLNTLNPNSYPYVVLVYADPDNLNFRIADWYIQYGIPGADLGLIKDLNEQNYTATPIMGPYQTLD